MKTKIDVNCDMGESFGSWSISSMTDEDILRQVSSANIAAGFHAGDPNHIDRLVRLAKAYGVQVGAHVGYHDLQGFGRRHVRASAEELVNDMVYQIGAVREFCRRHGVSLSYVKPHGALYMELAVNAELAALFLQAMKQTDPDAFILCMGNTEVYHQGKALGFRMIREFFADRDYDDKGSIVFVRKVDRPDPEKMKEKIRLALLHEKVVTVTGNTIALPFESICFHSDTPGCERVVGCITEVMSACGVERFSFV